MWTGTAPALEHQSAAMLSAAAAFNSFMTLSFLFGLSVAAHPCAKIARTAQAK
jgi:hypothetical protein